MDLMLVVNQAGTDLVMNPAHTTGELIEIIDGEQVTAIVARPDREQARLPRQGPLVSGFVGALRHRPVSAHFDVAHRAQPIRKLRTHRTGAARLSHRATRHWP
jgi:hypothetical protein